VTGEPLRRVLAALSRLCSVEVRYPCAVVSIVGRSLRNALPQLGAAMRALRGVPVHMLSEATEDLNLSFVVDEEHADRLVAGLHAELLEGPASRDDAQFGPACESRLAKRAARTRAQLCALACARLCAHACSRVNPRLPVIGGPRPSESLANQTPLARILQGPTCLAGGPLLRRRRRRMSRRVQCSGASGQAARRGAARAVCASSRLYFLATYQDGTRVPQ